MLTALLLLRLGWSAKDSAYAPALFVMLAMALAASLRALLEAWRDFWDTAGGVEELARQADARFREGDAAATARLARRALTLARSTRLRNRLWKTIAWAGIGKNDPFVAHAGLMGMQREHVDLHLLAAYLTSCNRLDEAVELLQEARECGHRAPETTKLLVDLLFCRGDAKGAFAVARSDGMLLSRRSEDD